MIAEKLTSNEAEAEAESEDDDDEVGASPTAAVQPSTLEFFQALDALRCDLYAGKADDRLHHHVAEIENFLLSKKASRAQQTPLTQFFSNQYCLIAENVHTRTVHVLYCSFSLKEASVQNVTPLLLYRIL